MKIGVWLGYDIKESAGGAFSYIDRLIQLIDEHIFPEGIDICFVSLLGGGNFKKETTSLIEFPQSFVQLIKTQKLLYRIIRRLAQRYVLWKGIKGLMDRKGIKLMYYLHQGECLDSNYPFIATNWDIGHRSTHAFPEVIWDGKPFEVRENFYRNILPKALMVFCESNTGKKELINYTNIGEHKIRVLPMFGGSVTTVQLSDNKAHEILKSYDLQENKFFFYPAQFWAHKNHVGLIKAYAKVLEKYPDYKLVLSGSDKGNKDYIKTIISEVGIKENVVFLGFVPIETLYCMYKHATALVMASHFGPTNMPPIEAMEIGCPVACSDLGGHLEILGDAASYFNSYGISSIYDSMFDVIENNCEYRSKIAKRRSISPYSAEKVMSVLEELLKEVVAIRDNWS